MKYYRPEAELLAYMAVYMDGEEEWVSNSRFNGLFKIHRNTGNVEFLACFPGVPVTQEGIHKKVLRAGSRLFFIPWRAGFIHVYDMESGRIGAVSLWHEDGAQDVCRVADAFVEGGKLFLFSLYLEDPPLEVDMGSLEVRRAGEFSAKCAEYTGKPGGMQLIRGVQREGGIYFVVNSRPLILEWRPGSGLLRAHELEDSGFYTMFSAGDSYWFLRQTDTDIYTMDRMGGSLRAYSTRGNKLFVPGARGYVRIVDVCGEVIVLPSHCGNVLRYDRERDKFVKAFDYPDNFHFFEEDERKGDRFYTCDVMGKRLILHPCSGNGELVWDLESHEVYCREYRIADLMNSSYNRELAARFWVDEDSVKKRIFNESKQRGLVHFLEAVKDGDIEWE